MFNDWLLSKLREYDWSQADLARNAGLTKSAISKYLSGRIPDETALRKIAKALNLPADLVFEKAGVLPPKPELSPTNSPPPSNSDDDDLPALYVPSLRAPSGPPVYRPIMVYKFVAPAKRPR